MSGDSDAWIVAPSRREFLKTGVLSGAAAATGWATGCAAPDRRPGIGAAAPPPPADAGPPVDLARVMKQAPFFPEPKGSPELLRVGVIGCGGRGTGAAINCVDAAPQVKLVALADLFPDHLSASRERLLKDRPDFCDLPESRCFVGFDAYQRVCEMPEVNLVILAAPPHFRPPHLEAAISAGKHVFMEKPVAVDPAGARRVIAAAAAARNQRLGIVAGTQRRHDPVYVETLRRIRDGAIGAIVAAQCYWNQGALWVKERQPEWSDMEWQCRNWLYFTWLSGDHIVEQHVHNLDVVNWAMGGPPLKCVGMGGRQARVEPQYGNIYDHFAVEYEYASGARVLSMCRQTAGASDRVSERLVGTKGAANPNGLIEGPKPFRFRYPQDHPGVNPYVQEHTDLIRSIRHGTPLNEGARIAESTLTAIMGRMSAYTGREMKYDWALNASELDLTPPAYAFGPLSIEPVATPGQTKLV